MARRRGPSAPEADGGPQSRRRGRTHCWRRNQSPQGAARGPSAGQHAMVGSVSKPGARSRCCVDNLLIPPRSRRATTWAELREDHQDLGDGNVTARNRAGRCGRVDRAHQRHRPAAGGRAMTLSARRTAMSMWRVRALAALCWASAIRRWRAGRRTPIQSINSTQQGHLRGGPHRLSEPPRARRLLVQNAAAHRRRPAGVSNGWAAAPVEINQGNLRSVNVAQAGERTRLVLNLKQASTTRRSCRARRWCWWLHRRRGGGQPAFHDRRAGPLCAESLNPSSLR